MTTLQTIYQQLMISGSMRLSITPRELPRRKRDDVTIRVLRAGVCGSDVRHFVDGCNRPFCHEYVGEVVEVNGDTRSLFGRVVAGKNSVACGMCQKCILDRQRECTKRWLLRSSAAAEYIRVPAYTVHPISANLPLDVATLIEPLGAAIANIQIAIAATGLDRPMIQIVGDGPMATLSHLVLGKLHGEHAAHPDCLLVYSKRGFASALEFAQPGSHVCVCFSTTNLKIARDGLVAIRDKLLHILVVVASPNTCFAQAESMLAERTREFGQVLGQTDSFYAPDELCTSILQNVETRKKTIIRIAECDSYGP